MMPGKSGCEPVGVEGSGSGVYRREESFGCDPVVNSSSDVRGIVIKRLGRKAGNEDVVVEGWAGNIGSAPVVAEGLDNGTSKPQREHGLLRTSHSLPQRGHTIHFSSQIDQFV